MSPTRIPVVAAIASFLLVGCGKEADTLSMVEQALGAAGEVWVTGQDSDAIFVIEGRGAQVSRIAVTPGLKPHLAEFSPSGKYAYAGGVGNGNFEVVSAEHRSVAATISTGVAGGTHQVKPSHDGKTLLVAQMASKQLIRFAADEVAGTWTRTGALVLAQTPICTVFNADDSRAYVSLAPSGLAVVDVENLTVLRTFPTDGGVQCGLVPSKTQSFIYVTSNGSGGKVYALDLTGDVEQLYDLGYSIGAADLHGSGVDSAENQAFLSSRLSDELKVLDLSTGNVRSLSLDFSAGKADLPDQLAVHGAHVFVALRASGALAIAAPFTGRVEFVPLAAPSPNATHGVAVRPGL